TLFSPRSCEPRASRNRGETAWVSLLQTPARQRQLCPCQRPGRGFSLPLPWMQRLDLIPGCAVRALEGMARGSGTKSCKLFTLSDTALSVAISPGSVIAAQRGLPGCLTNCLHDFVPGPRTAGREEKTGKKGTGA